MRKITILAGLILALSGVGAVLGQTSVDGLDLEAIDKRAQAGAADAAQFVKGILDRQARVNVDQHTDAQAVVDTANRKLAEAAARARPTVAPRNGVDLDQMLSDAGETQKPGASAPMFIAFASLSMPQDSLQRMIADVSKAGGMVVFRGFLPDGGKSFMASLMKAIPEGTAPHISIDPRLFRAYRIAVVPTYVAVSSSFALCSAPQCVAEPPPFDRIAGNVTAEFALETFADGNGPGAAVARTALQNLAGSD